MNYPDYRIAKHRRGLALIDSNLLLLLFVGRFRRDLISKFKMLTTFTPEDFDTLAVVVGQFGRIATTPNILTEVSNLSGTLSSQIKPAYYESFSRDLALLDEKYVPSKDVARTSAFRPFGITDAGIALIAKEGILVLTDDLMLCQYLLGNGIEALNFNHVRSWSA